MDNSAISFKPKIKIILRKFKCPDNIICGIELTMEKRQELFGKVSGGSGSMLIENYQRKAVEEGTKIQCIKTNIRINLRENNLVDLTTPNVYDFGYDISENFDGIQEIKEKKIYINFKCVCGKGGSQTRTLREVYWFIEGQFKVLLKDKYNVYFANIIDGDTAIISNYP